MFSAASPLKILLGSYAFGFRPVWPLFRSFSLVIVAFMYAHYNVSLVLVFASAW
jgi:hypothetical protein